MEELWKLATEFVGDDLLDTKAYLMYQGTNNAINTYNNPNNTYYSVEVRVAQQRGQSTTSQIYPIPVTSKKTQQSVSLFGIHSLTPSCECESL